jgi:ribonuclease HI
MGKKPNRARVATAPRGAFTMYFDGAAEPINPGGIATYGFVVRNEGLVIAEDYGLAAEPGTPEATNNVAEYTACIKGMEAAFKNTAGERKLFIFGDSKLVIMQTLGRWKAKTDRTRALREKSQTALAKLRAILDEVVLTWIPRNHNADADHLSKKAIWEALERDPGLFERIVMPFGKHRGLNLLDLPDGYYRWLWEKAEHVPKRPVRRT